MSHHGLHKMESEFVKNLCNLCRCSVCQSVVVEGYHCSNGHLTCRECLLQQAATAVSYEPVACAVCRDRSTWTRSLMSKAILEVIQDQLDRSFLRCDHEGCDALLAVDEMEWHRTACPHRPVTCPCCTIELRTRDLANHLYIHDDVIIASAGQQITLFMTNFALNRTILLKMNDEESAVFQIDCTGAIGRSGPFEMHQALLRMCCLTPCAGETTTTDSVRTGTHWSVLVQNHMLDSECGVCETMRMRVPVCSNITSCRAIAHPMALAECDVTLDEPLVHVGHNMHTWWNSSKMRDIRRSLRPRGEHYHFLRSVRRSADAAAALITFTLTRE